jgi:hypothetical protein
MSKIGFFSFVGEHVNPANPGQGAVPGQIIIRARARKHLDALLALALVRSSAPEASPQARFLEQSLRGFTVQAGGGTDYPFRIKVPTATAALLTVMLAEDIDYDNFKGAVKDPAYHDALMRVWSVMRSLESEPGKVSQKHAKHK